VNVRQPHALVADCRCPVDGSERRCGPWKINVESAPSAEAAAFLGLEAGEPYTVLRRAVRSSLAPYEEGYVLRDEIVMEDSPREVRRHLPLLLRAHGKVLVTGLGLGCVVRGLLSLREVEQVDVVEIDPDVAHLVWHDFADDPRVTLHLGDALTVEWSPGTRWDFAWHDLWVEQGSLQPLHMKLLRRYKDFAPRQGAWAFPREFKRLLRSKLRSRRHMELLG